MSPKTRWYSFEARDRTAWLLYRARSLPRVKFKLQNGHFGDRLYFSGKIKLFKRLFSECLAPLTILPNTSHQMACISTEMDKRFLEDKCFRL